MRYANPIRRRHVESSAVRSIGYDPGNWVLQIEFDNRQVYNYFRVPPEEYAGLLNAGSIGKYVNREVKPYYDCERLDDDD